MKRALATSLAILTLTVAALFAPISVAAAAIETSLMFVLQSNGDTYEGMIVSSSDNTINQSNCKDTDNYETNFRQKDDNNQCLFTKKYSKDQSGKSWIKKTSGSNLEFDFTPVTYSMRDAIAKSLSIVNATDLNVVRVVVALPLTATVTNTQTTPPAITKGDQYVYYTWNTDKDRTDIRLIGTMPLSNSTSNPRSSSSSSPTTSQSPGVTITPTPLAVKHKDSNTTLYIALGITTAVAVAGIVITILLTQKRRQPPAKYTSSAPSGPYNSQGYTGNQLQQSYPTLQNRHP